MDRLKMRPPAAPLIVLLVLLAAGPASGWSALQPAPAAQVPVAPAEDPVRLQLETQLKELQRREQFDQMELATREALLMNIINHCIELGRDFSAYQVKLKDVQDKLKAEGAAQAQQQERLRRLTVLKERGLQAVTAVPPRWYEATQLLSLALRLAPKDPEALALKAQVDRGLRQVLIRRIALGSLVGVAAIGLSVLLVKRLRQGRGRGGRQLEMLEGPQPGDVFRLDKEVTTLGALAAESDWVISDPFRKISRRHCEISRSGRHYFLTDTSSNGTWVNGSLAPKGEPILLRKNDRIALADDVILRFH